MMIDSLFTSGTGYYYEQLEYRNQITGRIFHAIKMIINLD